MPSAFDASRRMIEAILGAFSMDELRARQAPDTATPLKPWIRPSKHLDPAFTASHWRTLLADHASEADRAALLDAQSQTDMQSYAHNVENYIGTVKVPLGVIGPLRVNGVFAKGDYYAPLATTEAALVASYGRGARLLSAAGGCTTGVMAEGVLRAPAFALKDVTEAGMFVAWVIASFDTLKVVAESTTRHGKLTEISPHMEGCHVYLVCAFSTGDAAGQNMVTIAADAMCRHIEEHCPIKPLYWFVEGNFSGDKKASALSFLSVRGRKVTATVELSGALIASHLHTTAERMEQYWRMSALGGVMSGSLGVQGHYANCLAALYLATGQDVACVAESAVGVTRMELRANDTLFVSVTLPNVIVGTVGGGTQLPSQAAALNIMGLRGSGHARAFAEICAAVCLAGELSIVGALCAGEFARAHQNLARGKA
ncbi:MAG: hydroxymethylglutaryl-CoA reductase [Alphaproteobacteria bacterium]